MNRMAWCPAWCPNRRPTNQAGLGNNNKNNNKTPRVQPTTHTAACARYLVDGGELPLPCGVAFSAPRLGLGLCPLIERGRRNLPELAPPLTGRRFAAILGDRRGGVGTRCGRRGSRPCMFRHPKGGGIRESEEESNRRRCQSSVSGRRQGECQTLRGWVG